MTIDYELVYKTRPYYEQIRTANQKLAAAEQAVRDAETNYRQQVARLVGVPVDQLRFTNVACMAEGILSHVERGSGPSGVGKWKCVFCGCDDFDF